MHKHTHTTCPHCQDHWLVDCNSPYDSSLFGDAPEVTEPLSLDEINTEIVDLVKRAFRPYQDNEEMRDEISEIFEQYGEFFKSIRKEIRYNARMKKKQEREALEEAKHPGRTAARRAAAEEAASKKYQLKQKEIRDALYWERRRQEKKQAADALELSVVRHERKKATHTSCPTCGFGYLEDDGRCGACLISAM